MRKVPNKIKAVVYGQTITANTLQGIKCKASKIANAHWKSFDEMEVTMPCGHTFKYTRINRKCPDNTITYGQWK